MRNRDQKPAAMPEMPILPNPPAAEEVAEVAEAAPVKVKAGKGIQVMALRAGFYKQMRKGEGDMFEVADMEKVGSWMRCVDPRLEAEHQKILKAKKEEQKAAK